MFQKLSQASNDGNTANDEKMNSEIENFPLPEINTSCEMKKICSEKDSGKYLDAKKADKEVTKEETKGYI